MLRFTCGFLFSLPLIGILSGCSTISEDNVSEAKQLTQIETGYLQNKIGYVGDVLNAEVTNIEYLPEQQLQVIEIHVPVDPDQVDKIEVISPSGEIIKQDRTAKILSDYENKDVGLKLYFPKQKNWSFKLKLIDEADPE